ncbi:MAG TPA: tetratricopeptide repeat protein, partial [bacterium]|nr:tetratricopeptide repeat protein [bacterium]
MDPQILIGLLGPFVIIGVLMAIILPIKHRRRNPPGTSETREAIRLDAAGQLAEAAALFTTAIAKVERRKGRRSKEVADLLVRLGSSHSRHGDPDAAEAAYGEALEIYRALPKATPADRAEAQYGLFFVRTAQKRDREALQLLEEATLGFDATYGLNHPRTEDTHHYLVRHYIA